MHPDDDEDELLDEKEFPDASDIDDEEAESVDHVPCPVCGKDVYERAEFCPHCRNFITPGNSSKRTWTLARILTLLIILGILIGFLWATGRLRW